MNLLGLLALVIGLVLAAVVAVRALGGNIMLVDDWRKSWTYYSSWGMLVVAMLPELWNGLVAGGYLTTGDVPEGASWAIKIMLAGTFILRNINQVKPPEPPVFGDPWDEDDRAGPPRF